MNPKLNFAPIQAARGVAVLLVMLFHTSQMGDKYFHYNFLGVSEMGKSGAYTFFFVLTGYLMYTLYHERFGRPEAAGPFLLKRFMRIYPLYWLLMAVMVPVYFVFPSFGVGYERRFSVITESLLLWPQANAPVLPVAWSLSYVVFFYLAFALFFLLREGAAAAIFSSWFTIIVLHACGLIALKDNVLIQFLFSEVHLEFFAGMFVAYWAQRKRIPGGSLVWILAGALVYPMLWITRMTETNLHVDLLHTIGSVLILIGITNWRNAGSRILKSLVACGNASYSILLTSLAMLSITMKLARAIHLPNGLGAAGTIILCYLISVALSLAFYRVVEKPLLAWLKQVLKSREQQRSAWAEAVKR
ncbi:acyltransferase family protein [Paenibacillus cremeus]|uniref:Acyltransferase n=1 Tax=Paenibacillus cremeus TaxID=2163881 RepID=A0A559K974_9BACL|nr:acyltransferase [Paenibacillus cremeus]TVY08685.1 acyltransferase [Paenibacillus cremeus]